MERPKKMKLDVQWLARPFTLWTIHFELDSWTILKFSKFFLPRHHQFLSIVNRKEQKVILIQAWEWSKGKTWKVCLMLLCNSKSFWIQFHHLSLFLDFSLGPFHLSGLQISNLAKFKPVRPAISSVKLWFWRFMNPGLYQFPFFHLSFHSFWNRNRLHLHQQLLHHSNDFWYL